MKIQINDTGISIIPEDSMDRAYIKGTLGLKKEGESIQLKRLSARSGFDSEEMPFLRTEKIENKD